MTITDEQIEKAAKAAYESRMQNLHMPSNWDRQHEWGRIVERRAARAALEAVMPGELENECDCSERAPADEYWICPDCDAEWFPEEEAHPAPEPGELERLREALQDIARQKRTDELETEYDVECADFEEGYDAIINRARAALEGGGRR